MAPRGYDEAERHALAELGYALVREGLWADARAIWEGLAHVAPQDEAPWRALTVIAVYERRWEDAVRLASEALARQETAAARLLRSEACLRLGRYSDAAGDLERIIADPGADQGIAGIRRRAAALALRLRRPAPRP